MARWQPPSHRPREILIGAMATPDGTWRVEALRYATGVPWYRVIHGDEVFDNLTIAGVNVILSEAGVLADLVPEEMTDPNGLRKEE